MKGVIIMSNLPEKMKALVAYAPGDYRFEIVDTPRAGEGEMILKVEACGICAGDTKAFAGATFVWRPFSILPGPNSSTSVFKSSG